MEPFGDPIARSSRHAPRPQPASAQGKLTRTGPASTLHRRKEAPGWQQKTARAQAAAEAARAERGRARADAKKMLAQWRAEATREREQMRADLRARAERAEREADAYRAGLTQLRTGTGPDGTSAQATAGPRRGPRTARAEP
jgi:hypothetical protein